MTGQEALIERLNDVIDTAISDSGTVENDRAVGREEHDYFEKERDEMKAVRDAVIAALEAPTRITIAHDNGNTVTGTLDEVLNHGHLKPGWRLAADAEKGRSA